MHHTMKFSPVILVFTLVIVLVTAASSGEIDSRRFKACSSNEWIATNTTIQWHNGTKHLMSSITSNKPGGAIYIVYITMNCTNQNDCEGKPQINVKEVDCHDPSNRDLDVCRAAQEAARLEQEIKWLTYRYGPLIGEDLWNLVSCINIENTEYNSSNDDDTTESYSEEK